MIKAIETRYKGYRFRSRLEARWAVFFDALGVPWEYEAEGYELGGGLRWLPDFVVGDARVPFEIKPKGNEGDAVKKVSRYVTKTGQAAFVLVGAPGLCARPDVPCFDDCDCHKILCVDPLWYSPELVTAENPHGFFVIGNPRFVTGRRGADTLSICFNAGDDDGNEWVSINSGSDDGEREPLMDSPELRAACDAARSARFEHGETPR